MWEQVPESLERVRWKASRPSHTSERRDPELLTPDPPPERTTYRALLRIVLN